MKFYSQGNQGLPCELRHPAVIEDKDVIDDDTGKIVIISTVLLML